MPSASAEALPFARAEAPAVPPLDLPAREALQAALEDACGGAEHVLPCPAALVDADVFADGALHGAAEDKAVRDMRKYSLDKSFHEPPTHLPLFVCKPPDARGVAAVVTAARKAQTSLHCVVIARGAGTGVEGGCVPYFKRAIILSTERLKAVEMLPDADAAVVVGAGVLKNELNRKLKEHGRFFGPDPSSNPSIGGMISTGGSGLSTLRYGTTRENIVSLIVVTPLGELIETRRPVRKNSTGYHLTQLYAGAEGTLGIVCAATLRTRRIMPLRSGGVITFPSIEQACSSIVQVTALADTKLTSLVRCELMNEEGVRCTNAVFKTTLNATPTIFCELVSDGDGTAQMSDEWDTIVKIAREHGSMEQTFAQHGDALDELWDARRGCYIAASKYRKLTGAPNGDVPAMDNVLVTDVCVPLSELARVVDATESDFKAARVPCVLCAHIADGNFHLCVPFNRQNRRELAEVQRLEDRLIDRALAARGTVSGEHGVGVGKRAYIAKEHGPAHIDVQRRIKDALDPTGLLNPDKVLFAPLRRNRPAASRL